ncbi:MAG: hypothetical protein K6G80_10500 [Treponema sp.]|nr:hypothetical protein [Treponema sp.]
MQKNKLILCCALLSACTAMLSAKSKFIDVPGRNEVTVVGRIHFKTDMDKNWLMDTFGVPADKRNYDDCYVLPYIPGSAGLFTNVHKAKEIRAFNNQAWGKNGDYFFVQYKLLKDRTLYFSYVTLFIGGSYMLPVKLPLNFKVVVPEKEKFLYLGDFYYSAKGFAFELTAAHKDEYDEAQKALNEATKKPQTLCRANLEEITEEDIENNNRSFWYESVGTKFSNWYKNMEPKAE